MQLSKHFTLEEMTKSMTATRKGIDMSFLSEIKVLEEKVKALGNADTSHTHDTSHAHSKTDIKVLQTEIKLLKVQMEEIKVSTSNPLAN